MAIAQPADPSVWDTLSGGPPDSPTDEAVSAQAASSLFWEPFPARSHGGEGPAQVPAVANDEYG